MFLHKLRRTFAAMFWGWVACNLTGFLVFVLWLVYVASTKASLTSQDLYSGFWFLTAFTITALIYSGVATVVAWLVVLLPVDLCISDSSWLRRPPVAAMLGACGGVLSILAFWTAFNFEAFPWTDALPLLAACGSSCCRHGFNRCTISR